MNKKRGKRGPVRLESRGGHALAARRGCRACRRRADVHRPNHLRLFAEHVSIRQHMSAYVSIRQRTAAYVSIRQHACTAANCNARVLLRHHTEPARYVLVRRR
jgi:hypothetical protein